MAIKINDENILLVMEAINSQIEKNGSKFCSFVFQDPKYFHGISIQEQRAILLHLETMGVISNVVPITSTNN